jgi:hypothetical protein
LRRRIVLFGMLALSVGAAAWVSNLPRADDETSVVSATTRHSNTRNTAKAPSSAPTTDIVLPLDRLQREAVAVGDANPFAVKSWYVVKPAPSPPPPERPTVPPLPFMFAGKMQEDDGAPVFYLVRGDQSFSVKIGETFDKVYRLTAVEDGNLVIQYLPLSAKQLLPVGADPE